MTATGRNIMKIIIGSALGSAVAAGVAKLMEREEIPEDERVPLGETIQNVPVRLRERWEAAKQAGEEAEVQTTALLTEIFREKVNDPDALKPPRPPAR